MLALALREEGERTRSLAARQRIDDATWLNHEQGIATLRVICRRLGGPVTIRPTEYRREREAIMALNRHQSGDVQCLMPTENQLTLLFGGWDDALVAAGLEPRTGANVSRRASPTPIDLLDRCFECFGTEPTQAELCVFAQANGIPFPRRQPGRRWASDVEEWKEQRRACGKPVPDRPPPKRDRPDYGESCEAALPGEKRPTQRWTREDCVAWVRRYIEQLQTGDRPTQRGYDDFAAKQERAPRASAIGRKGGFLAVLQAARRSG